VAMSFLYCSNGSTQANGVIHGGKRMSVGSDGMSKTVSLYSIYTYRKNWYVVFFLFN